MKAVKITFLIVILLAVINFIVPGEFFHPAKALPFSNGEENSLLYSIASLFLIGITLWGILRLNRNDED